jgi:hypothetical protein
MKVTITDNGQDRPLTKEEEKLLDSYDLSLEVKVKVREYWSTKPVPATEKKGIGTAALSFALNLLVCIFPIVLICRFIEPSADWYTENIKLFTAVYRAGMVSMWIVIILWAFRGMMCCAMSGMIKDRTLFPFEKGSLIFFIKKTVKSKLFTVSQIVLIVALIINEYYLMGTLYLIIMICFLVAKRILKVIIMAAMTPLLYQKESEK